MRYYKKNRRVGENVVLKSCFDFISRRRHNLSEKNISFVRVNQDFVLPSNYNNSTPKFQYKYYTNSINSFLNTKTSQQ